MMANVSAVSKNGLCHGCGVCAGICPTHAISMKRNSGGFLVSFIDENKCINCGKCLKACSGWKSQVNTTLTGIKGIYKRAYIGYAQDKRVRQMGQSGGVVTALLCYLLETKKIDGAYVNQFVPMENCNKMVLAKTKDELLQSVGSYYCQADVCPCIGDSRSAVVLLGCQAESMHNLEKESSLFPMYKIGLFCAGNFSNKYITDLEMKGNVLESKFIQKFRFRDKDAGGWPGDVTIQVANEVRNVNKEYRMERKEYYQCFRCDLCFDRLNCFSDVAVGDPWGIECKDEKSGVSALLVRTDRGEELIAGALRENYIKVEEINPELVMVGQGVNQLIEANKVLLNIANKKQWTVPFAQKISNMEYKSSKYQERMLKYHRSIYSCNSEKEFKSLLEKREREKEVYNKIISFKLKIKKICGRES